MTRGVKGTGTPGRGRVSTRGKSERRTGRKPLGGLRLKLDVDDATLERLEKNDLVPRWINDENHGSRLRAAREAGYEFVETQGDESIGGEVVEQDRRIKHLVGTDSDGSPKFAYLMAIKREWYEEDQEAKEEVNRQVDDSIKAGNPVGSNKFEDDDKSSVFVKSAKIS